MRRHSFQHGPVRLSYLDDEGDGVPIVALHAHWMEAVSFAPLAAALAPDHRLIALDQRGHGHSSHAASYTRDDYVADLSGFLDQLRLDRPVLLGNSLGGVNAYQFAARQPQRVRALVIEDIGVEIADDLSFALAWQGIYPTRDALAAQIGPRLAPYLEPSFRQTAEGWTLAFDPRQLHESIRLIRGDHWRDWLASNCPALVLRGSESRVTSSEALAQMAARRPHTRFAEIEGGHALHVDAPDAVARAVRSFLASIGPEAVGAQPGV